MRVVADTGPLHYLTLIGQIDVLPRLFGALVIPEAVRDELDRGGTPALVRRWIGAPPGWLAIAPVVRNDDPALLALDDGERATISLAATLGADLILMDDRAGVAAARARGFAVTGTLGLLDRAARNGWLDLATALAALRATSFHVSDTLIAMMLREHGDRRGG